MVGIPGGTAVFPQREPAQAAVVELNELPISLGPLLVAEPKRVALANHFAHQIVEVGFRTVWSGAVWSQLRFHLEDAHVDPHLKNLTAIAGFHQAGADFPRAVVPSFEYGIDIARRGHAWHSLHEEAADRLSLH